MNELDLARVLGRAALECTSDQSIWFGEGLPQKLRAKLGRVGGHVPVDIAFVEVRKVSPAGVAAGVTIPPSLNCTLIGLSDARIDSLTALVHSHDAKGVPLTRLICPVAVFDFKPEGLVIREIQRGHTAAELQEQLSVTLWAGPDLKELEVP